MLQEAHLKPQSRPVYLVNEPSEKSQNKGVTGQEESDWLFLARNSVLDAPDNQNKI